MLVRGSYYIYCISSQKLADVCPASPNIVKTGRLRKCMKPHKKYEKNQGEKNSTVNHELTNTVIYKSDVKLFRFNDMRISCNTQVLPA